MTKPPRSPAEQNPRVAIVGGGPGGLLTAYFLERVAARPISTTIFEARERLGGKVLTPTFSRAPVSYEAGAAELYDYTPVGPDPLRELVAELGLPTLPLGGATVMMDGDAIANLDDLEAVHGTAARHAIEAFDTRARGGMTPREFYAADESAAAETGCFSEMIGRIRHPVARRYLQTMIHSDLATEPGLTSACYGMQNYLMNDPAYMRLYCIAGGNEQLIGAIAARITAEIHLNARATDIHSLPDGRFTVVTGPAGQPLAPFDAVVLALPLEHLATVRLAGPTAAEAVRRHCDRFDHPAHYLRVTVLFAEPYWRGRIDGGYMMLDAFGGCCLYDESARDPGLRQGVLGWLLAGEPAAARAADDDDALVAAALASLPASFGDPRRHFLEARVHRWINAVSALPGGWQPPGIDRRHQPDPVLHPRLFVVGDYLYDSTLNGVLDSAEHVAGWLAAEFG
jgi:monoamine oxidase